MNKSSVKQLNKFAIPLLFQMVATYFIGATDVAIVGQISVESLNATSLVSSTLEMIAGVLGGITITLNILLGQSLGENDKERFSFEFYTSIFLSITMGIIFSILIFLFGKNILNLLFNLDNKTLVQALKYLRPMTFYLLLQLVIFAYTSSYKVLNKTKYILYISVFSSVIDVTLDYIFVLGKFGFPKMGVEFVGFSTIFTMFISILAYTYFLKDQIKFKVNKFDYYLKNTFKHFKLSIVLILQEIIDGSVYGLFVNMILIRLGKINYAGYIIINTIIGLLFLFKYVYGSAVLSMISIESGASNKENMITYPRYSSAITLILYILFAIVIMIFNKNIISLFSENKEAIIVAENYILWFILINLLSCISYSYKLALQAINKSKFVLYSSIIFNVLAVVMMFVSIIMLKLSFIGLLFTIFIIELLSVIIFVSRYVKFVNKM